MTTWLKTVGFYDSPVADWRERHLGFRTYKPTIRPGDHVFLYASGGSRRIFALAEAISGPEKDPNYREGAEGSCRWRLAVRYVLNLPVAAGIHIDDVVSHRGVKLRIAAGQKSHTRLRPEEGESARKLLQKKVKK